MNAKQKSELIELIKNDCKKVAIYISSTGETCAIGCLALAAGATKEDFQQGNNFRCITHQNLLPIVNKIQARFGLEIHQQRMIQSYNDNDSQWSSQKIRAQYMLPLAIAQLGSVKLNQQEASDRLVLITINTIIADLAKKYKPEIELSLRTTKTKTEAIELCLQLKHAAAANAATDAATYAAADVILIQSSNNCLQVLKEMNSPGCKYLWMIE